MTTPVSSSTDLMIRDYLARLAEAGTRQLPKGERMAFVGRIRGRIDRECAARGQVGPVGVAEVLAGLGEPEELVHAERARLDDAWAQRRARHHHLLGGHHLFSGHHAPAGHPSAAGPGAPGEPRPGVPHDPAVSAHQGAEPGASPTGTRAGAALPPGPGRSGAGGADPAGSPASFVMPGRVLAAPSAAGAGHSTWLAGFTAAARVHKLEAAATVLLGLGGLLFPVLPPVWLLGSGLSFGSRIWDVRDRWVAVAGPLAVTVVGALPVAAVAGWGGDAALGYLHGFGLAAGYLLRLGCLASAGYLAWRMRRGPRRRVPPWRRPGYPGVPGPPPGGGNSRPIENSK